MASSTPISISCSSGGSPVKPNTQDFQSDTRSAAENQVELAKYMKGLWIGPMPVQQFLDDFLPAPATPTPAIDPKLFEVMSKAKLEKDMYQPFVSIMVT